MQCKNLAFLKVTQLVDFKLIFCIEVSGQNILAKRELSHDSKLVCQSCVTHMEVAYLT